MRKMSMSSESNVPIFLSFKGNTAVKTKAGHAPHYPHRERQLHYSVFPLCFTTTSQWAQNTQSNPARVIIIIIIIIFNCKWAVAPWQWLLCMYINMI